MVFPHTATKNPLMQPHCISKSYSSYTPIPMSVRMHSKLPIGGVNLSLRPKKQFSTSLFVSVHSLSILKSDRSYPLVVNGCMKVRSEAYELIPPPSNESNHQNQVHSVFKRGTPLNSGREIRDMVEEIRRNSNSEEKGMFNRCKSIIVVQPIGKSVEMIESALKCAVNSDRQKHEFNQIRELFLGIAKELDLETKAITEVIAQLECCVVWSSTSIPNAGTFVESAALRLSATILTSYFKKLGIDNVTFNESSDFNLQIGKEQDSSFTKLVKKCKLNHYGRQFLMFWAFLAWLEDKITVITTTTPVIFLVVSYILLQIWLQVSGVPCVKMWLLKVREVPLIKMCLEKVTEVPLIKMCLEKVSSQSFIPIWFPKD